MQTLRKKIEIPAFIFITELFTKEKNNFLFHYKINSPQKWSSNNWKNERKKNGFI